MPRRSLHHSKRVKRLNRVCALCGAGTFAGSQIHYCQTCDGVNEYQDQSGQSSCKTVSSCPAGQGVTQNATTISNTQCEHCNGESTYSDVDSKTEGCKEIKKCPAGYRLSGHSNSHEGTCVECGEGTFISETDHRINCTAATCADGVTQTPLSTRNRLCQACQRPVSFNQSSKVQLVISSSIRTNPVKNSVNRFRVVQRSRSYCDLNTRC